MVIVFLKKAMKFSSIITVLVIVILLINSIVVSISFKEQLNKPNYFIDYSNSYLCYDKKYFYNSQHLNKTGAELFSKEVSLKIKEILNKK